jgi:cargo-transport protein YPP1
LTAESEFTVVQAGHAKPGTARPATAGAPTASAGQPAHTETTATASYSQYPSISQYIPQLLEAIEKEKTFVEDEFQAQVCLGWIHWQLGEPSLALSRLPKSVEQDYAQLDGTNKESAEWTKVCALKASYIKGSAQGRTGAVAEALESYESAMPILTSVPSTAKQPKELRSWTELYLTGFCMLSSHAIKSKISSILETETLSVFRAWAKFWEGSTPSGGRAPQADVSRRQVWKQYYLTLSDVLQQDLPFPTTSLTTAYAEISTRLQQRAELKKVEAQYEALLLAEVQFPRADEASDEVEAFVDLVIQNWQILCGSSWSERDLGGGGAEALSRGVLDILYRAATKTFHSTRILRHLFTVHLAVAEFDLSFKAFDTYMEIVKKGKARFEKTGEEEHGLDDDETVLRTASECIKALCRYGSRQGAEKAKDLGQFFEDWLEKHHPSAHRNVNGGLLENGNSREVETTIPPKVFALAWRCIGIAHAQWARLTYDAPSRSDIQLQAIKCFRRALMPQYESTNDVETLFALGTILAERRELAAAIEVVKSGLLPRSNIASGLGPHAGRFTRERSLIPMWHLMALLLSARQDFLTAARSCEGAFEQFQDPKNLFGEADLNGTYRSDHLNEKSIGRSQGGVVDDMDDFERESVLEVKMTQLALIEVLEGPEVAVNASDELLSLYTRLFVDPKTDPAPSATNKALAVPPKSSAGTIKSITGSIFGRSGRSVRKSVPGSITSERTLVTRPKTTQTIASKQAPTIQVTSENGTAAKQQHHEKLQKRSDSISKKRGPGSARERSSSAGRRRSDSGAKSNESHNPTTVDGEKFFTPPSESSTRGQWLNDGVNSAKNPNLTNSSPNSRPGSKSLPPKSQQMAQKEPSLKPAHQNVTVAQDTRLPHVSPYSWSTNPSTRFPKDQQRRRRSAILVKVWLLISGFYRRASLYEDAKGGIEEAHKLVKKLEDDVSRDTTGHVSIDHPGWGGGKSIAELWGDVFSEVSCLNLMPTCCAKIFESGDIWQSLKRLRTLLLGISNPPSRILLTTLPQL